MGKSHVRLDESDTNHKMISESDVVDSQTETNRIQIKSVAKEKWVISSRSPYRDAYEKSQKYADPLHDSGK